MQRLLHGLNVLLVTLSLAVTTVWCNHWGAHPFTAFRCSLLARRCGMYLFYA
jgi:hypothetical protein